MTISRSGPEATPWQTISVTGSAGKSSTAAMIATLLHICGQRTATLDASYLHSPLERLRMNGEPVAAATVEALLAAGQSGAGRRLDDIVEAFLRQEGATWLVHAGRPAPDAARYVFTPILPSAGAAAGTVARALCENLPRSTPAIAAPQRESAIEAIRQAFDRVAEVADSCRIAHDRSGPDGQEFRLQTPRAEYRLNLPLLGRIQTQNAATAILAVEQLSDLGVELNPSAARAALGELRLPGRLELIKRRPSVLVDSGSSVTALTQVAQVVREQAPGRRLHVVLDVAAIAEPEAALRAFAPLLPEFVAVLPAGTAAAAMQAAVAAAAGDLGLGVRFTPHLVEAIDGALMQAEPGDTVCIAGSRLAAASARELVLGLMPVALDLDYTE